MKKYLPLVALLIILVAIELLLMGSGHPIQDPHAINTSIEQK